MKRKQLHEAVRECLPQFESLTKDDKVIVSFSGKKNKRFKSKAETQHTFTLHKWFIDTQSAINKIARLNNKKPNDFNIAGNKDKRGVTIQTVYCKKLTVDHIMQIRLGKAWPENMEISNFEIAAKPLQIGDLYGNQFKIALRVFDSQGISAAELEKSNANLTQEVKT